MRKTFIGLLVSWAILLLLVFLTASAARSGVAAIREENGERHAQSAVPLDAVRPASTTLSVAILLFDGVQIIDYSGPWEVFGQAGFRVFTVAQAQGPVTTVFGERVLPDYTFADAPQADILLVPGGHVDGRLEGDQELIGWIRERSGRSGSVLSVCTGALLLARAGLLDGQRATTYHGSIDELAALAPAATVVSDERFVDNGKIVVAAGLSSGIDGALHVVEKLRGVGAAEDAALRMEYDWDARGGYVRAALPDKYISFAWDAMPGPFVSREGDRHRWRDVWWDAQGSAPGEATARLNRVLATRSGWKRIDVMDAGDSRWAFIDERGRAWLGAAHVQAGDGPGALISLEIERPADDRDP